MIGRRKMEVRQHVGQLSIDLFGKRLVLLSRPQPGLYVGHRDFLVERRKTRREGGCRVALHDDEMGACLRYYLLQPGENLRCKRMQALSPGHDAEVYFRPDAEHIEHLVQHFPVLCGHAYQRMRPWPPLRFPHDRREFYGLRSRSENDEQPDFFLGSRHLSPFRKVFRDRNSIRSPTVRIAGRPQRRFPLYPRPDSLFKTAKRRKFPDAEKAGNFCRLALIGSRSAPCRARRAEAWIRGATSL